MSTRGQVIFVKWGGSLITDKTASETVRTEVIDRLAAELRELLEIEPASVVLGHGSGSFGHAAARAGGWTAGSPPAAEVIAATQAAAGRLHRHVVAALMEAGVETYSLSPSGMMTARNGRLETISVEPLTAALDLGLLPVVHGDVVLDREIDATIFSTERVFLSIVPELRERGFRPAGAFWLGDTCGVLDLEGRTIAEVNEENLERVREAVTGAGAAVADVTGGMRHRLESALELARHGLGSWILDGRAEGSLRDAVRGRQVRGTHVGFG